MVTWLLNFSSYLPFPLSRQQLFKCVPLDMQKKYTCEIYLKGIASSITLCFLLRVCEFMLVYVHVCGGVCMEAKRDHLVSCSAVLHLLPSRQDCSLNLGPSCWPVGLVQCDPFVSAPHSAGVRGMHSAMAGFPHRCWV